VTSALAETNDQDEEATILYFTKYKIELELKRRGFHNMPGTTAGHGDTDTVIEDGGGDFDAGRSLVREAFPTLCLQPPSTTSDGEREGEGTKSRAPVETNFPVDETDHDSEWVRTLQMEFQHQVHKALPDMHWKDIDDVTALLFHLTGQSAVQNLRAALPLNLHEMAAQLSEGIALLIESTKNPDGLLSELMKSVGHLLCTTKRFHPIIRSIHYLRFVHFATHVRQLILDKDRKILQEVEPFRAHGDRVESVMWKYIAAKTGIQNDKVFRNRRQEVMAFYNVTTHLGYFTIFTIGANQHRLYVCPSPPPPFCGECPSHG
jgi:hypothetical protein